MVTHQFVQLEFGPLYHRMGEGWLKVFADHGAWCSAGQFHNEFGGTIQALNPGVHQESLPIRADVALQAGGMAHSRVHVLRIAKSGTRFFIKSCSLQYGSDDRPQTIFDQKAESYKWIKVLSP